tara:strand:+ start:994 stop:1332 length:339 start_codon:yes stop_codon:yes gene_type:complete
LSTKTPLRLHDGRNSVNEESVSNSASIVSAKAMSFFTIESRAFATLSERRHWPLSDEAREELVFALSASLKSVGLSDEWREEIAARLERLEAGTAKLLDAREIVDELRAKLG